MIEHSTNRDFGRDAPLYLSRLANQSCIYRLGDDILDTLACFNIGAPFQAWRRSAFVRYIITRFRLDCPYFCSWLGLAPSNDVSSGKILRSRTLKTDNR